MFDLGVSTHLPRVGIGLEMTGRTGEVSQASLNSRREQTQHAARGSFVTLWLRTFFSRGLTRFNIKSTTHGDSQLLSILYI